MEKFSCPIWGMIEIEGKVSVGFLWGSFPGPGSQDLKYILDILGMESQTLPGLPDMKRRGS